MATLQPYKKYNAIAYDYTTQLPDGWRLLPNIAVFQERIERGYENEELLSVTIGRGVIKQTELEKKDSSTLDKSKYLLVYPDDLVYSMRFRQGASGYSNYKGIVSPACTVLKPRKGIKLNSRFYHYMFRTGFYKNYAERYAYGIADGQMPLRYFDFKRMYSIVPPIEVQNSIVMYLDKKNNEIDKFIRNKERLIELLEEKKQSIVRRLATKGISENAELKDSNVNWIGKIPTSWTTKKIKYLGKFVSGFSFDSGDFIDEGVKVIKISNIQPMQLLWDDLSFVKESYYNRYKSFRVVKDDLVFALTRPIIKGGIKVAIVDTEEKLLINQRNAIYKPNKKLFRDWLYFVILNKDFISEFDSKIDNTGQQPNISTADIGNIYIPYPTIDEQKEIVNTIRGEWAEIDLVISKAQKEISSIKEYRETLITDLVTGKRCVPKLQMS